MPPTPSQADRPAARGEPLSGFDWLLTVPSALLLAFMVVPLVELIRSAPPAELWAEVVNAKNWQVIANSVTLGAVAAVSATVLGVPLAYLLARREFPGKRLVEAVVQLPVALPHVIIGLALLVLLGPRAVVGAFLADTFGIEFLDTRLGVITAMMYVSIPYIVTNSRAGFEAVPDRLEKTARSLGASSAAVFFEITLPLARRRILDGISLTWGRSISELGAIMILAYQPLTVAVYVWDVYKGPEGLTRVRTVGALALAVYLSVFLGFRLLTMRKGAGK
jgi:molybdate/tungstate transport system permease protein